MAQPPTQLQQRLASCFYRSCAGISAGLLLPLLALHPRLCGGLGQRLGRWQRRDDQPLWLHGSSAGDMASLLPLASELERRSWPVALSCWTRAGQQLVAERWSGSARLERAPLDLGGPVRSVLRLIRPRLLVLERLELWPQLLLACAQRRIPVAVVNGCLSPRSLKGFSRWRWLFQPRLEALALVSALTEEDAQRFVAAGTPAARVRVALSTKHDQPCPVRLPSAGPGKLVLGCIHREEERALLPALKQLATEQGKLELVVAPRYPQRALAVLRQLRRLGLSAQLSSAKPRQPGALVVDQMGRLAECYRGASLAFIGGSLAPHGGHNPLEAARWGVPLCYGPHTAGNKSESNQLLQVGAAQVVSGAASFLALARWLLADEQERQRRGQAALALATRLQGASSRLADALEALALAGGQVCP